MQENKNKWRCRICGSYDKPKTIVNPTMCTSCRNNSKKSHLPNVWLSCKQCGETFRTKPNTNVLCKECRVPSFKED